MCPVRGLDAYLRTGGYIKGKVAYSTWQCTIGGTIGGTHVGPHLSMQQEHLACTDDHLIVCKGEYQCALVISSHQSFQVPTNPTRLSLGTTGGPGHPVVNWPFPVTQFSPPSAPLACDCKRGPPAPRPTPDHTGPSFFVFHEMPGTEYRDDLEKTTLKNKYSCG